MFMSFDFPPRFSDQTWISPSSTQGKLVVCQNAGEAMVIKWSISNALAMIFCPLRFILPSLRKELHRFAGRKAAFLAALSPSVPGPVGNNGQHRAHSHAVQISHHILARGIQLDIGRPRAFCRSGKIFSANDGQYPLLSSWKGPSLPI
jgi:hypothetical protein